VHSRANAIRLLANKAVYCSANTLDTACRDRPAPSIPIGICSRFGISHGDNIRPHGSRCTRDSRDRARRRRNLLDHVIDRQAVRDHQPFGQPAPSHRTSSSSGFDGLGQQREHHSNGLTGIHNSEVSSTPCGRPASPEISDRRAARAALIGTMIALSPSRRNLLR
jgi:hypothetical protein